MLKISPYPQTPVSALQIERIWGPDAEGIDDDLEGKFRTESSDDGSVAPSMCKKGNTFLGDIFFQSSDWVVFKKEKS